MHPAVLSRRAVDLAARLNCDHVPHLARWLYRFGTLPSTVMAERDFGNDDEPMAVLGLTANGKARRRLEEAYEGTTHPGWHSFSLHDAEAPSGINFKLYVSPRPEAIASAFPIIVDCFSRLEVRAFKVGRGLDGLLRPDKIVAYFDSVAFRERVAADLAISLSSCPAQGVPFTGSFPDNIVAADGLLSHGIDPPPGTVTASWRAWITLRLAEFLVEAHPKTGSAAAEAALRAADQAGIDTRDWSANAGLFITPISP
jgi:hypothetical protein